MTRAALALAAALLLAGCVTKPTKILVPCKAPDVQRPAFAFDALAPDAGLFDAMKALLAEREQREVYEDKLRAALSACR